MKTRKERYFGVPLCQSDCNSWFEACEEDYTCADNWMKNFTWTDGDVGNQCMKGSTCRKFKEMYSSANDFCEKVSYFPVFLRNFICSFLHYQAYSYNE